MPPLKSGFVTDGWEFTSLSRHHEIKYFADIVQGAVPALAPKTHVRPGG